MRYRKWLLLSCLCLWLLRLPVGRLSAQSNAEKYPPGLIVIGVGKGSPAEQAGLQIGDFLLSYDGKPLRYESELGPYQDEARFDGKRLVQLIVRQEAGNKMLTLTSAADLGIRVRPPLPPGAQKQFDAAMALAKGDPGSLTTSLKPVAEAAIRSGDDRAAAWIWRVIYAVASAGSEERNNALLHVLRITESAGDRLLQASALELKGDSAYDRGMLDVAHSCYMQSLMIKEGLSKSAIVLSQYGSQPELA